MHFCSFPRTEPPAPFVSQLMEVSRAHQGDIGTLSLSKGLYSHARIKMPFGLTVIGY
jgi:hypothetical protein